LVRKLLSRSRIRWSLFAIAALLVLFITIPQVWAWYHLRAAQVELAKYNPEEARKQLALCADVWGWRPSVRLLASRAARQAGELDAARQELRECQRLAGGVTDETVFEWALLQAASGDVREVEDYIQKRANSSPEMAPLAWEALAEGYLRIYRLRDAKDCLDRWLKQDPDNIRATELRGTTFVTGKGVVRGADDYRKVLSLDPNRKQTRWRLIGCLLDLGGYEEASQLLEDFARANPDDPDGAARLARCYFMLNREDEARELLTKALTKHPDDKLCLRTSGQFAMAGGRLTEAESTLRHATAVWPEDYQTQWLLFETLRRQGKDAEAKEQNLRAQEVKDRSERIGELQSRQLADYPLDPALHYEMGILLIRTGHPDVGEQWLHTALGLDPNHKPSHTALADYYDRIGDKVQAEEHRRRAKMKNEE